MIEVRDKAEIPPTGGETVGRRFDPPMFRIRPKRIISIGIEGEEAFGSNARSVKGRPNSASRGTSRFPALAENPQTCPYLLSGRDMGRGLPASAVVAS
jgi:hypothetical protein